MSLSLTFDELLRYTNGERDKWRAWFGGHADALEAPVQAGRPVPDRRASSSITSSSSSAAISSVCWASRSSDRTGLTGNNAPPLFDYGASVRRELEQYVSDLRLRTTSRMRTGPFEVRDGEWSLTPRKLLFHILLHETRHWAQIALAVRLGGFEPPGDHDLFYSKALR